MEVTDIQLNRGQIVRSKMGRDRGEYYVVIELEEGFVKLANGKTKKLKNLKRKNIHHLERTNCINTELETKLKQNIKINDDMIGHAIQDYLKNIGGKNGNRGSN